MVSLSDNKLNRKFRPKIDPRLCKKCLVCSILCPDNAITISDKPSIDYSRCKGCLICFRSCPYNAITEERE